ncbi:MAG TPA: NifU family protein [Alphaproteobacteria bacterium]|jgi:Fe-S cluster biogenesis protein NfuA|nr:NifU family protein [Alphaproteobacteria bacterium]
MFIQTELTPNPKTVKFIPGKEVSPKKSVSYKDILEAENSPLAKKLFLIDGIDSVFLGSDFISITKTDNFEWQVLKPLILSQVMQHYMSDENVIDEIKETIPVEVNAEDKDIAIQIEELLETRVRPSVAGHGGDIVFHSYSDGVVELEMRGACSGCPSSLATLKMGVENMLKHYIPEIMEVKEVL